MGLNVLKVYSNFQNLSLFRDLLLRDLLRLRNLLCPHCPHAHSPGRGQISLSFPTEGRAAGSGA